MRLCALPLNHIMKDQLGYSVGEDPETCEKGGTLVMKAVMSGVEHTERYFW